MGPLQRQVLRVLYAAHTVEPGARWMLSTRDISRVLRECRPYVRVYEGSVVGAISGMSAGRGERFYVTYDEDGAARFYYLTLKGIDRARGICRKGQDT